LTTRTLSTNFDVGKIIQGWYLKFSGKKGHSVEEFFTANKPAEQSGVFAGARPAERDDGNADWSSIAVVLP